METIHDIVFFPGIEKSLSTFENDLAQEQKQTQECVKIALKILGSFKFFCFILFNPCKYVHYATANMYLTHTIIITQLSSSITMSNHSLSTRLTVSVV